MINDFMVKILNFIKSSDVNFRFPEIRTVELRDDSKEIMSIIDEEYYNRNRIADNLVINSFIFFSVLDSYLDVLNNSLERESFRSKYNMFSIEENKDKEIIIKEIYRVLKLIRNAIVHKKSSISIKDRHLTIYYEYKRTVFKLKLKIFTLELIYTTIVMLLEPNCTKGHNIGLLRTYYDEIKNGIEELKDDIGEGLKDISDDLRLKRSVRYLVLNPKYNIIKNSNNIKIQKYSYENRNCCSADYLVKLDNRKFLIPDEILDDEGLVRFEDLKLWEESY